MSAMMPRCIGMMLPAIDKERRADVVSILLSSVIDKGTSGMSDEDGFMDVVMRALKPQHQRRRSQPSRGRHQSRF